MIRPESHRQRYAVCRPRKRGALQESMREDDWVAAMSVAGPYMLVLESRDQYQLDP